MTLRRVIIWVFCILLPLNSIYAKEPIAENDDAKKTTIPEPPKDTYTINFNNVSIIEFIRFVSKIAHQNFVFEESDLNFNVTVVSEETVSPKNVMSILAQVLRARGLMLLEQENNILITTSTSVHQIATLVSPEIPNAIPDNAAIITRVFRIKNVKASQIATIIRPMTSEYALVEVAEETHQLIVTDIATNIDKIAELLIALDSPHIPLEIESYTVKNLDPQELILLTNEILAPFKDENPLIFVPQIATNEIYIVSTAYLVERAIAVMEDLDVKLTAQQAMKQVAGKANFLIYHAIHRTSIDLETSLGEVANSLATAGYSNTLFLHAIQSVRNIPATNSLVFIGDKESLNRIHAILSSLDTSTEAIQKKPFLFTYRPEHVPFAVILKGLDQLLPTLEAPSAFGNADLVTAIRGLHWVPDMHAIVVATTADAAERLKNLIAEIDVASAKQYYLYKVQHVKGNILIEELKELAAHLPPSTPLEEEMTKAINQLEWIPTNNSILITGTTAIIEEVKVLISSFDIVTPPHISATMTFYIYKPVHVPAAQIEAELQSLATDLSEAGLTDKDLMYTLSTVRYVPTNQSLLFTGTEKSIEQVKELLKTTDVYQAAPKIQHVGTLTFMLYKLQYISGERLISSLKSVAKSLETSPTTPNNEAVLRALSSMKYIKEANAMFFTGTEHALTEIEKLCKQFDIPSAAPSPPPHFVTPPVPTTPRSAQTFVIYEPKYLTGEQLISILCDFKQNLICAGVREPELFDTIDNLRWIPMTSSLLVSGNTKAVEETQKLLSRFDVPQKLAAVPSIESIENASFLVYKLQYQRGIEIQAALRDIATSIAQSTAPNPPLANSIQSLQWIPVTNSLIATGPPDILTRLKSLIENLDVPLKQVFIEVLVIQTTLTNAQNFGLNWGSQLNYKGRAVFSTGNFAAAPSATESTTFGSSLQGINASGLQNGATSSNQLIPFLQGFDLGVIGDIIRHKGQTFLSLGSLVNALENDADSTVVFNQKIVAQDNRQASLFVGVNYPYTGALVNSTATGGATTNANIEYRDVGISLAITPIIGDSGTVALEVVQDISSLVGTAPGTPSTQITGITTNRAHFETRANVPDTTFLALTGIIQDTKSHTRVGIPCLGSLPVLGAVFSQNNRDDAKTNVIIFVRPQVIKSTQEFQTITEHQEWQYKDQAALPHLKEEFDAGVDMVKTPENE